MRVVFLDIDGVINHCNTHHHVTPTTQEPLPIPIDPRCMECLNRLIAETGAKIVISSSWRAEAHWTRLGPALVRQGLVADVIGETPDLPNNRLWLANWEIRHGVPFDFERLKRGWEIAEWLAAHPEVTSFVILDDVSDMDALIPWLVLTHPNDGLTDPDVERAKYLLDAGSIGGRHRARDRDGSWLRRGDFMQMSLWWIPRARVAELSASGLAVLRMCRVVTLFLVATIV